MPHVTPQNPAARPPFLIREAGAADITHISSWLPEALRGTPAARVLVAADAPTLAAVGVAAAIGLVVWGAVRLYTR